MKLRLALALLALASPAFAQSLPTPNLGTGTKLNGTTIKDTATKSQGTSVADPGTGNLEMLLPVQTVTGASKTFSGSDLYKETRRSNSGAAMTDTFPATSTAGLANGTTIQLNNVDTTANITVSAGTGTTLNGNVSAIVPPNRSTKWVYDAPNAVWRTTANSLSGVNGPASATSGNIATFNGTTGTLIQDSGKAAPAGTIVGTSDTQTLANKSIDASEINSGTLGSARMPALTGSCTTGAGTVSVTCEQDGGATSLTAPSGTFAVGTSGATLPTAYTATIRTKTVGTKLIYANLTFNVTNATSGTNGFYQFTLPNSWVPPTGVQTPCSPVYDASLGSSAIAISAIDSVGRWTWNFLSAPVAHTYASSCVFEIN